MRRVLTGLALLFMLGISVSLYAASATGSLYDYELINFNEFEANIATVVETDNQIHQQELANNPDLDLSSYGYHDVNLTGDDWALSNWQVELCSSADTIENNVLSYAMTAQSEEKGEVLGVRVHFPAWRFLSWALIKPPFEIFAQYDDGSYVNEGAAGEMNELTMGLLVNVGLIQKISIQVYGLNFQHQLGIRLMDRDRNIQEYYMGSLYFHKWRELTWINPDYANDPRDRDTEKIPLYPRSYPYLLFDSVAIYKPETDEGGDFVTYIKGIDVSYEKAILEEEEDIDHEDIWNILSDEQTERRIEELKDISEEIYLRQQVLRRMGQETD